jgi:hypothetical protein
MAIPAGCYRVVLNWTPKETDWPGEVAQNTLSFKVTADVGEPQGWADQIAQGVVDALQADWSGVQFLHGTGYGITLVKCSELDTTGHVVDVGAVPVTDGSLNGSAGGGILPPEVAVALSLYGYTPGGFAPHAASRRGRIYLPYIAKSACGTDGKIGLDLVDSILTGWNPILTALRPFDIDSTHHAFLGILSESRGDFNGLTNIACDNHFDSQRRRQHQSPAVQHAQGITTP